MLRDLKDEPDNSVLGPGCLSVQASMWLSFHSLLGNGMLLSAPKCP